MFQKIFILLLLLTSLSYATFQKETPTVRNFSERELIPLLYTMMSKISKHYYYKDRLNLEKIEDRLRELKEERASLDKESLYTLVNLSMDGDSGFYTKTQMLEKFAFMMDDKSSYEVKSYGDISYINLQKITYNDIAKLRKYLKEKKPKKIILDLRNNFYCASLTIKILANFFISDGIIYSRRYLDSRGEYSSQIVKANKNTLVKDADIVILINGKTASVVEAMVHSVKFKKNIELIGQDSAGKSNSYHIERFNGDDYMVLADAEYFYQNYNILNNIGLNPEKSIQEDNEGVDKTLIYAIKTLKERK
jgi:C-terminal processing protease CtpA/Prc